MSKQKIIIIGSENNYNELGLVRSFGENGIKPYGIIICFSVNKNKEWLHRSKYWEKVYLVKSPEEALQVLKDKFSNEEEKPVVTTPIDIVVHLIDENYNEISKNFIVQSINGKENEINRYANKLIQAELTRKLGFETLPTVVVELDDTFNPDNIDIDYPLLLKPVAGGEGSKDDITICRTRDDYIATVDMLRNKKYTRILCQRYLENRTEIISYGALNKKANLCSLTVLKNIRQWPLSYGVGSFGELVTDERILNFAKSLYTALMNWGYDGPIDTDIFLDNDTNKIYVSEYNWRPGGRNYTSLGTGVYSIVLWYLSHIGEDISKYKMIADSVGYTQNDDTDFNHVIAKNITYKEWKKAFDASGAHALWNKKDIAPAIIPYLSHLKKLLLSK